MERLKGQKVWLVQFDDEDDSLIGVIDSIGEGFIALRSDDEADPTLWVNLINVREIEVFRDRPRGKRGHLSVVPMPGSLRVEADVGPDDPDDDEDL